MDAARQDISSVRCEAVLCMISQCFLGDGSEIYES